MFFLSPQSANVSMFLSLLQLLSLGVNLVTTITLAHSQPSVNTIQIAIPQTSITSFHIVPKPTQLLINTLPSTQVIPKLPRKIIQERDSSQTRMSAGAIAGDNHWICSYCGSHCFMYQGLGLLCLEGVDGMSIVGLYSLLQAFYAWNFSGCER